MKSLRAVYQRFTTWRTRRLAVAYAAGWQAAMDTAGKLAQPRLEVAYQRGRQDAWAEVLTTVTNLHLKGALNPGHPFSSSGPMH